VPATGGPFMLCWQLVSPSIVDFGIRECCENIQSPKDTNVHAAFRCNRRPLWPMCTYMLPEEGVLDVGEPNMNCTKNCMIIFDFRNRSRFFPIHIELISFVVAK
jgi:hypothetical protein